MIKLVSIEPVILEGRTMQIYTAKDKVPYSYHHLKKFIEKHGLQLGDDIGECLKRSVSGISPVRPEPTEEQKATKPKSIFST